MDKIQSYRPWKPVVVNERGLENHSITKTQALALRAMAHGQANEEQQKLAVDTIVNKLCGLNDLSFRPDDHGGQRETDFAEGKRFVGAMVRRITTLPLELITEEEKSDV
jgi:hypothetical protein